MTKTVRLTAGQAREFILREPPGTGRPRAVVENWARGVDTAHQVSAWRYGFPAPWGSVQMVPDRESDGFLLTVTVADELPKNEKA